MPSLPMFPLGTVLMPGAVLPLRVFEERYVALVTDLLHGSGTPEFGVVSLRSGSEVGDGPVRVQPVGCSAVLEHVDDLDDGGYTVRARGVRRFHVESLREVPGIPYRVGEVEWLDEPLGDPVRVARLARLVRTRLIAYRLALGADTAPIITAGSGVAADDARRLSYSVADLVALPPWERQRLLEAPDTADRLDLARRLLRREHVLVTRLRAMPHTVDASTVCPN